MNPYNTTRKGQSAIEYLTTYGWALLAILVVGAFLVQFGIFDQCQPSDPDFGPGDVAVSSWAFDADGNAQFTLQAIGNDINVTAIDLEGVEQNDWNDAGDNQWEWIDSGSDVTVTVDLGDVTSGSCVSSDMQLTYDIEDGIQNAVATSERPLQDRAP